MFGTDQRNILTEVKELKIERKVGSKKSTDGKKETKETKGKSR